MAAYYPIVPGVYQYAKGFKNIEHLDLKYLGAIAARYTWIPAALKEPYRLKEHFLFSDFVGFDVDNTGELIYPLAQAIEDWCDSACVIGITRSHQKEKVTKSGEVFPPQDRFRIITQWERRIETIEEYEYNVTKILKMNEAFDTACKDATRAFYPCQKIVFANFDGFKQPVKDFIKIEVVKEQSDYAKAFRSLVNPNIPLRIKNFLENGIPFKGSRNHSVYVTTLTLLEKGVHPEKIVALLENSPFDRQDFSTTELITAINSAVKKFTKKN
jgi:hypothetical protein